MASNKFIQIDSFSLEDTNDLFEAICTDIAKVSVMDAKRSILELTGTENKIRDHKCTLGDVITLIGFYDIPFKFRVHYLEESSQKDDKKKISLPDFNIGNVKDPVKTEIERQHEEITNHELKDVAKVKTMEVIKDNYVSGIDPSGIPDFKP